VNSPAILDDSMINRAAPPGSMRYFSVLYAMPSTRALVTALYVIDAEIRESAQSLNHDVAHTRLQWWRQEVDRLVNGNAQHPATKALNPANETRRTEFSKLHELIAAADMDLARMTYLNRDELRAYCSRSGGAVTELMATLLVGPALDAVSRAAANRVGLGVRLTEIIRDSRADAHGGRLYAPLDVLDETGVKLDDFAASEYSSATRSVLRQLHDSAVTELDNALTDIPSASRAYLRPLIVLGALHRRLLTQLAKTDFQVAAQRAELGAFEKPWTAWRAARSAG
jgi:phytoene synthase